MATIFDFLEGYKTIRGRKKERHEALMKQSRIDLLEDAQTLMAQTQDEAGREQVAKFMKNNLGASDELIKTAKAIPYQQKKQRTPEQITRAINTTESALKNLGRAPDYTDKPRAQLLKSRLEELRQESAQVQGKKIVKKERQVSPARLTKKGLLWGIKPGKPAVREEIETLEPLNVFGAMGQDQTTFGDIVPSIQDQQPATPQAAKDKMTAESVLKRYKQKNTASPLVPASLKKYPQSSKLLIESEGDIKKQTAILKAIEQNVPDELIIQAISSI